jgi:hypothetical protein
MGTFAFFNFIRKIMRLYSDYLKHTMIYWALFSAVVVITGCSLFASSESSGSSSDSSGSSSDSSKSISDSTSSIISSPSSISGKSKKYQNEISDYTMAYVKSSQSNADYTTFFKGLSDIAAKEGVTNWDQDSLTYMGIGIGLKKANVKGVVYETYKKNFAGGNSKKIEEIQNGYDSAE